jgi:hypothetical protein
MARRRASDWNELEYKGKQYLYIYENLRDDSDMPEESGYNLGDEEAFFNVEIFNDKEELVKEVEWEADATLEITDNDVIKIINKYKL